MLTTNRLTLRFYLEEDLENLHTLLSNAENMYYLPELTTKTIEETKENLDYVMKNEDGAYFCMFNRHTGAYIGGIGYTETAPTPARSVHLGYFILPQHQRQGYTLEGVQAVLNYAFSKDNCLKVTTGCYSANT